MNTKGGKRRKTDDISKLVAAHLATADKQKVFVRFGTATAPLIHSSDLAEDLIATPTFRGTVF